MEKENNFSLSDTELEIIYKYLSATIHTLADEEKIMWYTILEKFDPEFDEEGDEDIFDEE